MKKIKISIVVPMYNVENNINELLVSLEKQKYKNIEILLIDDGSTDKTKIICNKWELKDKRIKYFGNNHMGVSKTRNFGIEIAGGDYICFVDADDLVSEEYISDFVNILIQENDACMIACDYMKYQNTIEINDKPKQTNTYKVLEHKEKYNILTTKFSGYVWNKIYNLDIIKKYNCRFKEDIFMGEDTLFNFDYLKNCKKIAYLDKKNYYYKCDYSTASKNTTNIQWFSVYKPYEEILQQREYYDIVTCKKIIYIYNKYIIEGMQRCHYVAEKEKIEKMLKTKWKNQKKERNTLDLKSKLKLKCFYYFRRISYDYLRRKVMK